MTPEQIDAMEAAEKVGLFSIKKHHCSLAMLATPQGEEWAIFWPYQNHAPTVAPTDPLAICAAILETQKGETR